MSNRGSLPPDRVPTLTEVVAWPALAAPEAAPAVPTTPAGIEVTATAAPTPAPAPNLDTDQLTQRVLTDLHRQIDLMLDYRLREVLTPLLTRAADSIVREARVELASTLRDVVARVVAQELARHRTP